MNTSSPFGSEIAVIGMAGRFPGASNLDEFWRNLCASRESITFFSDEDGVRSNGKYVPARGVLADIELFDASFFGFTPREAEITDPQHRLFLECAWTALEDAGYDPERYDRPIAVYAGTSMNTYLLQILSGRRDLIDEVGRFQIMIGNHEDYLCTRVSYKLNLKGPSITVGTACSTSLVAIHLACQSLLNGECDMALAGGVTVRVPQQRGYRYQEDGILSPDGHCRTFDARAQGTVFGNGVGIVVLKRLREALADGDSIHAIVKGSAINNDGALKVGYTAPSVEGQAEVIAAAQAMAGVESEVVTYIEAHGTATPLGDPIEISALTQVFRAQTEKRGFCAIGSVKTNVGHLDAAAGVAGFIKTILSLKHGLLPPSLHFERPNPRIDFANSPFYVNTELREWTTNGIPRRAGVSSFGIGGTNAHVVLEEAPKREDSEPTRPWQLLVLSAKTSTALDKVTENLVRYFKGYPHLNLADVSYTLQVGRRAFTHRRVAVCKSLEDAAAVLERRNPDRVRTGISHEQGRRVVFMFPGQGAQYVNMGKELYESEAPFRKEVDRCTERLRSVLGKDLRELLYPGEAELQRAAEELNKTAMAQPALFVVEYALAQLWMAWGVRPQAMIGHSIGEYVAACLAGVISLDDALRVVATRGQLMQALPRGAMLAVPLPAPEITSLLGEKLSLAAINSPSLCVVSGPTESIVELEARLGDRGVQCRRLHTSRAFHSAMMEPVIWSFTEVMRKVVLKAPEIPYLSNVTGTWITAEEATDPSCWGRHLRETVRFGDGLSQLLQESACLLLEVGPGHTLNTFARQHDRKDAQHVMLTSIPHPEERISDVQFLLTTLGQLWLAGVSVNWPDFHAAKRHRLSLPTYPFERRRYWVDQEGTAGVSPGRDDVSRPLRKNDVAEWFYIPAWKSSMLPRPLLPGELEKMSSRWLMFVDGEGLSQALTDRLEQEGQEVIRVLVGVRFERRSGRAYTINPAVAVDYFTLLQALHAEGGIPRRVVHCWALASPPAGVAGRELFQRIQNRGYYSLLFFAQALLALQHKDPLSLVVLSTGLQEIGSPNGMCPEKMPLLGPCKVIPQELQHVSCRSLDVVLPTPESPEEAELIDRLLAEMCARSTNAVVAYRGNQRMVQTFENVVLDLQAPPLRPLRPGGVYLITGGLGRIGLLLADYLAREFQARLVLLGRSPLPERAEWEKWLKGHPTNDETSRKLQRLLALEERATDLLVMSADVAEESEMREALKRIDERFGALHGVFHAAGVLTGESIHQPISKIGYVESETQFRPKVYGLYTLDRVLEGRKLDFCLLFSSNAAVLGGLGLVAYAAANLFMDAFVASRNQGSPFPWISTNWDVWLQEDRAQRKGHRMRSSMDEYAMVPAESLEALVRVLSAATVPQVVVAAGDLTARHKIWIEQESSRAREPEPEPKATHSQPDLAASYAAPQTTVEQAVAEIWESLLGIGQVGIQDNFFELGGHSLLGTQLMTRIREAFKIELSLRTLFERPTVAGLAESIQTLLWLAQNQKAVPQSPLNDREEEIAL